MGKKEGSEYSAANSLRLKQLVFICQTKRALMRRYAPLAPLSIILILTGNSIL
jgi:hypothetical protein